MNKCEIVFRCSTSWGQDCKHAKVTIHDMCKYYLINDDSCTNKEAIAEAIQTNKTIALHCMKKGLEKIEKK